MNPFDDTIKGHEQARDEGWLIGGLHRPRPVGDVPKISLVEWRVFRLVPSNTIHFCGWNITEASGRVSSFVEKFDPETRIGQTQSGRLYELVKDRSGLNRDAEYVVSHWLALQGFTRDDVEFVTAQYE
jgi:hypothetical protein